MFVCRALAAAFVRDRSKQQVKTYIFMNENLHLSRITPLWAASIDDFMATAEVLTACGGSTIVVCIREKTTTMLQAAAASRQSNDTAGGAGDVVLRLRSVCCAHYLRVRSLIARAC